MMPWELDFTAEEMGLFIAACQDIEKAEELRIAAAMSQVLAAAFGGK